MDTLDILGVGFFGFKDRKWRSDNGSGSGKRHHKNPYALCEFPH